jgi:hypothetical protein
LSADGSSQGDEGGVLESHGDGLEEAGLACCSLMACWREVDWKTT